MAPTQLSIDGGLVTEFFQTQDEPATAPTEWSWFPFEWSWWVILQLLFALLGIMGNVLVMIVLFNKWRVRRATDTLIGALACADFSTSVFLLPTPQISSLPSSSWLAGFYCKVIHPSLLMWISVVASIYTLTAISIERYIAVAYPLYFRRTFRASRTKMYIIFIWLVAIAVNSFQFFSCVTSENSCIVTFPSVSSQKFVGVYVFMVEFIIPAAIMIAAQLKTAAALQKQTSMFSQTDSHYRSSAPLSHVVARKRILQLLLIVMTVFIACWGPDQMFHLVFSLRLIRQSLLYGTTYRVLVVLAFVNSCANPIIYTICYPQFRTAIKDIFTGSRPSTPKAFFEMDIATNRCNRQAADIADNNITA